MASDLKKVGLIFKSDGSADFVKTLKSVNNELKQNYENFRLTQAQYDNNTSSSDKLKDRMDYLTSAVDSQTKKVIILKAELENLKNAENRNEEAIEKKQIAVTQAESSLERYKNQQKEVSAVIEKGTANIEDFAKKVESSSNSLTDVGKKLSVASFAVGAIGITGAKAASDFDEALSSVKAISSASSEEMLSLRDKAEVMGATTKFSATEAANAMYYMALAGWKTENMIDGIEGVMHLAAASGEDLATVSDIVTDGLTAMGYSADMSSHYADILAKTVTNSNSTVETLGEAMKYAGSIGGALNIDMKDLSVALGLMANAGIKGSQAGTSLRSILQRLSTDTGNARSELEKMGINVFDNNGKMRDFGNLMEDIRDKMSNLTDQQKTQVAKTVAGTNAMSGFLAIINSSDDDFDKLTEAVENCNGAAQEMSEIMLDNAKGDFTIIKSQLEGLAIQFSEHVMPILRDFLQWVQNLLTKFSQLSPHAQKIILIIGALIIAIGPLLVFLGKIGTGVSTLITGFTKLKSAFGFASGAVKAFTAFLTPTNLMIVAIIASVVMLAITIFENWENIKNWTANLGENISAFFFDCVYFIKNLFSTDWTNAFGLAGEILNGFFSNIENFASSAKNIFQGIITFLTGVFAGDWKKAWEGIKQIFKGIFDLLYSIAVAPINLIISAINVMISGVNKVISGLNKIRLPDWDILGSAAGKGINISPIDKIAYLAKGGELVRGTAIVGEAGPEMLVSNGGKAKVYPLNGTSNIPFNIINYEKIFEIFLRALNSCKMKLDKDGFIRFIDSRLNEVV